MTTIPTISIANLPSGTPTSDDILVFVDRADGLTKRADTSTLPIPDNVQNALDTLDGEVVHNTGNETVAGVKTFSSSPIVPTPTTGTQASNKDYSDSLNPNFYKYSIVRTVASGNLTVALKNYEGNDPTPTKPVKIMIGGVLRTITSALSRTRNAGTNWFNAGSSELATKEIDFFVYINWVSGSSSAELVFARIPYAIVKGEFSATTTDEKFGGGTASSTDDTVNIGRFNATLSAGAGYTWSIPATSVIVNSPIYDIRNTLTFDSTITASGSMNVTSPVKGGSYYKVQGDMFEAYAVYTMTLGGTASGEVKFTIPFSINNVSSWMYEGMGSYWNGTVDVLAVCTMDNVNKNIVRVKKGDGTNFTLGAGQEIKFMVRGRI